MHYSALQEHYSTTDYSTTELQYYRLQYYRLQYYRLQIEPARAPAKAAASLKVNYLHSGHLYEPYVTSTVEQRSWLRQKDPFYILGSLNYSQLSNVD